MLDSGKKSSLTTPATKPVFAPKAKGAVINSTPSVDPALKGLAYNRRKKFKLG